jgi:hypothetical protein
VSKKSELELLEAQSEETSQERLGKIWETSRSVKVRKAVASNPNASPDVLKAAARLYLDEVVTNPGFEMLHLFDAGDVWIKDVADAYNDPDVFLMTNSMYYWVNSRNSDSYLKACLLSKKLSSIALDRVLGNIAKASLRRTIKNPYVKQRIRELFISEVRGVTTWPFELGSVILLYMEGVIDREELRFALMNYGVGSSSAKKQLFTGFVSKLQQEYRDATSPSEQSLVVELLGRLIVISRSHTLNWMHSGFDRESLLNWTGDLYSRVFKLIVDNEFKRSIISSNIQWLGNIVATYVRAKFLTAEHGGYAYSKERLEGLYNFVAEHNLSSERFHSFGLMLHGKEGSEELAKCSMETKEFFIRAGCLGNWVSTSGKDPKYLLAEEVNNSIFDRSGISGDLLYNKCSVRKIVAFDDSTHIY